MKMTRDAFDTLITENMVWLVENSPDCLERNHILSVLGCASESHYGKQSEIDRLTRELAERDADPSYSIACETIRNLRAELAEAKARAVPDGWVAVPVEPPEDLLRDIAQAIQYPAVYAERVHPAMLKTARRVYCEMLSARPESPPNGLPSKESGHE